jgi:hypothetical protein
MAQPRNAWRSAGRGQHGRMRTMLAALLLTVAPLAAGEASTVLTVTAVDDGLPSGVLTYQWSVLTKPAGSTVRLLSATSATTAATMDTVGTYRFQVQISDGELATSGTVDVTAVAGTGPGGGSSGGGGGGGGCGLGSVVGAIGIGLALAFLRRRR